MTPPDIVTRLRQTRADMIGTDDEQHYWDCHDAAAEIERLRLTDAEREAVEEAIKAFDEFAGDEVYVAAMRGLLDRLKPIKQPVSDRPQPISDARLAALEEMSALDQKLELEYGLTGNPMIKAQQRTPPTQPTPGDCSLHGDGTSEPVAWWLRGTEYDTGCEYEYVSLLKENAEAAAAEGGTVVPLYRSPTLTDEEREAVETAVYEAEAHQHVRRAATLRGLLERMA